VQHYKNIRHALGGESKWQPDVLPIYPMILTLEDWFIFSPRVDAMLKQHIHQKLHRAGIPLSILDEMPCTIASSHEFELAIQVIAQLTISQVMGKKTANDQRMWSLLPFIMSDFKEQVRRAQRFLFAEDWEKLMPAMPDGTTFESIRDQQSPGEQRTD
jgi:hypothetical protein